MGKGKLAKFADMAANPLVVECPFAVLQADGFDLKGKWNTDFFHNDKPIVLELGCGRGEYTVGLGRMFPDKNYIGVDIKGARMWTGAQEAVAAGMQNVGFLRTNIEFIDRFFAPGEVSEVWLTFSDPQMKKVTKRLTGTAFLQRYRAFMQQDGQQLPIYIHARDAFCQRHPAHCRDAQSLCRTGPGDDSSGTVDTDLLREHVAWQRHRHQVSVLPLAARRTADRA